MTQNQGIDYGMGKSNIDSETGIRFGVIHHGEVGAAWYESSEADYGPPICPKCGGELDLTREYKIDENPILDKDGEEVTDDYYCSACDIGIDGYNPDIYMDEPLSHYVVNDQYTAIQGYGDADIFVEKAPYFTYAQFCSPCAPGAGHLMGPFVNEWENSGTGQSGVMAAEDYPQDYKYKAECAGFPKVYCFGHDWYENGKAPYPVFSVETGEIVKPV